MPYVGIEPTPQPISVIGSTLGHAAVAIKLHRTLFKGSYRRAAALLFSLVYIKEGY